MKGENKEERRGKKMKRKIPQSYDQHVFCRTISLAYSRIRFTDIAKKLLLDSPEDAEFIVAKV